MTARALPVLAVAVLAAAGCGSSSKDSSPGPAPQLLPPAASPDVWAKRIVDRVLRPLNKDLVVLNNFNNPQIRVYIVSKNAQTLRVIHQRFGDLKRCSAKLTTIGPPPGGQPALTKVETHLRAACKSYEEVAQKLLQATDLFGSGDTAKVARGEDLVREAAPPSRAAAGELTEAVQIGQRLAPFRRAGLRPSV